MGARRRRLGGSSAPLRRKPRRRGHGGVRLGSRRLLRRLGARPSEAELAREFLKMGLYRNAAGKAFQAWKAVVAARAAERIEDVRKAFPGARRLRGSRRRVEKAYWIAAVMPTSLLKPVSQIVGGEISPYTNIALWLREYRYNGPDPQVVLSPTQAANTLKDIEALLEAVEKLASTTP